ncbi:coronatine-insensitive protein 1-like protein isoform X1 [Tanacetum coccineum]
MENHPHEAIDTVLNCVIPYIQNGDDRNSVSSVCRKLCELEGMTRKHVTVHLFYSPTPSRLHQRFPSIESLTLKGLPDWFPEKKLSIDINQWIQEIAVSFRHLKSLHIRHMDVHDSDLELLARTRGRELRVLKISKCKGFSTDGLLHIGKYCNDLRTLCLKGNQFNNKDGNWLHELALQNTGIESLDFRYFNIHAVKDLTLLAKNCCRSLVSLKIAAVVDLIDLVDVFRHAVRLEDFVGGEWVEDQVYAGFKFPTSMRCMGICDLTESSFPFVLPFAHQLRELHLIDVYLDDNSQCLLIKSCPNLEVLYTTTVFGDTGLQVIGRFCKKLLKFKTYGWATQMGLITMAKGCLDLECLYINLTDISNEILNFIGTHLKNLRDFHMTVSYKYSKTSLPLDDGILAMLIGCSKLERLRIRLRPGHGGLTDVCLRYIGKYGHNLRYLSLGHLGESAVAGLVCLSKGCPKLRKLKIQSCPFSKQTLAPFVCDIHMLRYVSVRDVNSDMILAMTHPNFQP